MNVYVDYNFLIYCAKNPAWRRAVLDAHRSGTITVVLSAWHFYEYGNASGHPETEDLIQLAEELQPKWILELRSEGQRTSHLIRCWPSVSSWSTAEERSHSSPNPPVMLDILASSDISINSALRAHHRATSGSGAKRGQKGDDCQRDCESGN